ncbi:protein of unknown function [Pseudomonas mediterranea]
MSRKSGVKDHYLQFFLALGCILTVSNLTQSAVGSAKALPVLPFNAFNLFASVMLRKGTETLYA